MKRKLELKQKVNLKTKQHLYLKIATAVGILSIIAVITFFAISYFSNPKDSLAGGNNIAQPSTKTIIISEFAGKGHEGEKNDQFVELHNMTAYSIDLSNYELVYYKNKNKSESLTLSGVIPAEGYYVIAVKNGKKNKDKPTNNLSYDILVPNNGWKIVGQASFVLKNNNGVIIDYAGNANNSKLNANKNYDRIDFLASGENVSEEWLEINKNESTPSSKNFNHLPIFDYVNSTNTPKEFGASSTNKPAVKITSKGNKHPGKIKVIVNPAKAPPINIKTTLRTVEVVPDDQPDNVDFVYYYLESELNGLIESNLALYSYHNNVWNYEGGIVDTVNNTITLTNLTHFSMWTAGDGNSGINGSLPIKLAYFTGEFEDDKVLLNWATSTEINNDFFTIESSENGIDFKEIAKVDGAGNSITKKNYSITDNEPNSNIMYYRLTQTDYDGKYEVFPMISVKNTQQITDITIENYWPNPFEDIVNIRLNSNIRGSLLVNMYNSQGAVVRKQEFECEIGINTCRLNNISSLKPGVYLLNVSSEKSISKTIRLIRK